MKDQPSTCKYNVAPASKDTASWKNSGYFLRQGAVSASKEFFFVTDLHSGFLRSSRYLPPGIFHPNDSHVHVQNDTFFRS